MNRIAILVCVGGLLTAFNVSGNGITYPEKEMLQNDYIMQQRQMQIDNQLFQKRMMQRERAQRNLDRELNNQRIIEPPVYISPNMDYFD